MIGTVLRRHLAQLGLGTTQVGGQRLDELVGHHFGDGHVTATAHHGAARAALGQGGLDLHQLRGQFLQALVLDVDPLVAGDDAAFTLIAGQLVLGSLDLGLVLLDLRSKALGVFLRRLGAQIQGGRLVGVGEAVGDLGSTLGTGPLGTDGDGGTVGGRGDLDGLQQHVGQPVINVAPALGGLLPVGLDVLVLGELQVLDDPVDHLAALDQLGLAGQHVADGLTRGRRHTGYLVDRVGIDVDRGGGAVALAHQQAAGDGHERGDGHDRRDQPESRSENSKKQVETHRTTWSWHGSADCEWSDGSRR